MRDEAAGGPAGDPGDLGGREIAPGALVGDRGVDVAVGDDDGAALQCGADDGVDVLGAVRGVQQGLGAVREAGAGDVEEDRAQPLADRGRPRLAGHDDLVALGPDPLGQRLGLGGLAGPVAALQSDEEAGRGGRGGRVVAAQRVPQVAAERDALPVVGLGEEDGGDRQQQGAEQHQGEGGAPVGEDELAGLDPVAADAARDERGGEHGDGEGQPDHGLEVLALARPAELLRLLVDQGVPGLGRDARRDSGEQQQEQHGRDVGDEPGGEQGHTGQRDGQRQ